MLWPLVIVSTFAAVFVVWLAVQVRASARLRPLQEQEPVTKNDADKEVVLMILPMLMTFSSG